MTERTRSTRHQRKSFLNVLGVVYLHTKTSDGGDLYLTRFAEKYHRHLELRNWYSAQWFNKKKLKLLGTSAVYKVPTKRVGGKSLDIVVKNCRVGEDVPLNTHTLQEFCDAEFNSPWEEFALVMEMREGKFGPEATRLATQRPLAIYVPPERMQPWQSGRSRTRINRIRARHPGIDLDILKQYKLIYEWIDGMNLREALDHIGVEQEEAIKQMRAINKQVHDVMNSKGYYMADMKPEHIIIRDTELAHIREAAFGMDGKARAVQVEALNELLCEGKYSVIDYELLFRTVEHEEEVKEGRRRSYLEDQRDRFKSTSLPAHLKSAEIMGVPYVCGHAESTGGHLWVVGRNGHLFDYFLPERWRRTPSLSLSKTNEVYYTMTKDNIHLVWKTSRVGELPKDITEPEQRAKLEAHGVNSPFEEFSLAFELNRLGIHCVYVRAIYMTGTKKMEPSEDLRKYKTHREILDLEGNPVLHKMHNYITIQGYYNGPDEWVADRGERPLHKPVDLDHAVMRRVLKKSLATELLERTVGRLAEHGYDGTLLSPNDLLVALDERGRIVKDATGEPDVIICNLEFLWRAGAAEAEEEA